MTLRPAFSLINSEFNEFLFASIGDEANGMPLSVMSALTRLGIDPWGEAARLSALPRGLAAATLAPIIVELPGGHWGASEARRIAARLVALLPERPTAAAPSRPGEVAGSRTTFWLVCIVLLLAGCVLITMDGRWPWSGDRVPSPLSDTASPRPGAFSGEVDAGSPSKMRPNQTPGASSGEVDAGSPSKMRPSQGN